MRMRMRIDVVHQQDVHLALRKNMATWEKVEGVSYTESLKALTSSSSCIANT